MKIKTIESAELYYEVEYEIDLNNIPKELRDEVNKIIFSNNKKEERIKLLKRVCEEYGTVESSLTDGNANNFKIEEIKEIKL